MSINNVTSRTSQALADYAAQLQVSQQGQRPQRTPANPPEQGNAPGGDKVTLSAQSSQNIARELQANRADEAVQAAATERNQDNSSQATRAAASKSVTQALEAYVQVSLV